MVSQLVVLEIKGVNVKDITLESIRIPFLIRKRNKGHNEIESSLSVSTHSEASIFEFLILFFRYSRSLLTYDSFRDISETLGRDFQLSSFSLKIDFHYLIDRVSINYSTAPFPLECSFISENIKGEQKVGMSISVPIRISSFYNNQGTLKLTVFDSSTLFFEDLLDYVVKASKVRLFPILSSEDFLLLDSSLRDKSPQDYLDSVKGCSLGKSGRCIVEVSDFYNMYKIRIQEEW